MRIFTFLLLFCSILAHSQEQLLVVKPYGHKAMIRDAAVSKDKKELLVIELKKGKASDNVVGQIQRYMGFVSEMLAEKEQVVKGIIIALEDDIRIRRALSVAKNIEFYRYEITFKLSKAPNS